MALHFVYAWQRNFAQNHIADKPCLRIEHIEGVPLILHTQIEQTRILFPNHTLI